METVCVGLYQGGVMAHTTVMTSLTNHLIAVIVSFRLDVLQLFRLSFLLACKCSKI